MNKYNYRGRYTRTFAVLQGYKNLVAWQAASDLGGSVSALTNRFGPGHYRLANQMRGAAISVSGNLAEGYCSGTLPNYIRYCHHARGSLAGLGSYLQDCEREQLAAGQVLEDLLKQYSLTSLFLDRLIKGLAEKAATEPSDNTFWLKEPPAEYHIDEVAGDVDGRPALAEEPPASVDEMDPS